MEKTKIYDYYAFGYNYRLIIEKYLKGRTTESAVELMGFFMHKFNQLDIPVSKQAGLELNKIYKEMKKIKVEQFPNEYSDKIKHEMKKIDATLDAELQLKETYVLTDKRYSIDKLLNKPYSLLAENILVSLSDTSKLDFSSACTQIALNQPTASAFHLMRALEEEVKNLYYSYKKTKRLKKPMWGPIMNELRTKRAPKPSDKLLNQLDGMRIHFRNPTQHPDKFYSMDEAQDLLNQTITAINMIHSELP